MVEFVAIPTNMEIRHQQQLIFFPLVSVSPRLFVDVVFFFCFFVCVVGFTVHFFPSDFVLSIGTRTNSKPIYLYPLITEKLNVLYERNWTMLVHEQLRRFEVSIIRATKSGLNDTMFDRSSRWSFTEAFLYSLTLITTIGKLNNHNPHIFSIFHIYSDLNKPLW